MKIQNRPGTPIEVFSGRLLAACVHPWLAWRVSSTGGRLLVAGAYFVAAFVATLGTLLAFSPIRSL